MRKNKTKRERRQVSKAHPPYPSENLAPKPKHDWMSGCPSRSAEFGLTFDCQSLLKKQNARGLIVCSGSRCDWMHVCSHHQQSASCIHIPGHSHSLVYETPTVVAFLCWSVSSSGWQPEATITALTVKSRTSCGKISSQMQAWRVDEDGEEDDGLWRQGSKSPTAMATVDRQHAIMCGSSVRSVALDVKTSRRLGQGTTMSSCIFGVGTAITNSL